MNYSQLRAFHAVAIYGGFSKAAAKLNRTQPAISDQVRKLEKEFDVLLFDRHKRSVRLTDLGHRLLETTRRLFEMENEAMQLLSESQALQLGHLKIAADASLHLIQLVGEFRGQYPGISISLTIGNSGKVLSQLLDYEADIGVLADAPEDNRFLRITLRSDPLVAFVDSKHPWADRNSVSLAEFATEPLVMREEGSITRCIVEEELNRIGVDYKLAMVAEGQEATREAVAAGVGVGIVSLPEFGFDPRLKALKLKDCDRAMTESLVCLKARANLRGIHAFWTVAKEHVGRRAVGTGA
jgi:aminoethylphosphonate catabolism LysR family transcriptional regulator